MKNNIAVLLAVFILALAGMSFAQISPSPAQPGKISLEAKGMDVIDVLKMLASESGYNIVVGKDVGGKVTLVLKDVDPKDAFEIILLSNDLASEMKNGILNISTQKDYEQLHGQRYQDTKQMKIEPLQYVRAQDIANSVAQIKSSVGKIIVDANSNTVVLIDSPDAIAKMEEFIKNSDTPSPLKTMVFSLNYARAEKLGAKVQEILTKGVGYAKVDERTNKIAVTDYPQKMADVAGLIAAFDERTPQVLIDSQIIQVSPSDLFEMGVDWDYWIKKYFEVRTSLPVGTANRLFIGTTETDPTQPGKYKAVIDALRTIGDTKVLSSPRIMALNDQEAKIHVGTKEAYITATTSQGGTGTTVSSQTVNFVDTGIELSVTPTVSRDGFVTMKIKPAISDAVTQDLLSLDQKTTVPIVTSSEAETTVTVKDGVTIIIGGLSKESHIKTVKKIPLLGDIPWLGAAFRSTSDNITKQDLVILLTPHIMSGEHTFSDFSEVKPLDGTRASMVKGHIVFERTSAYAGQQNLKNPEMLAYSNIIKDKITDLASVNSPKDIKGTVIVSFTLSSQGQIVGEPVIVSSSDERLNPFVMDSLKHSAPFPLFPKSFAISDIPFTLTLEY